MPLPADYPPPRTQQQQEDKAALRSLERLNTFGLSAPTVMWGNPAGVKPRCSR